MKKALFKGILFIVLAGIVVVLSNTIYARWFYHDDVIAADAKMLFDLDSLQNVSDILFFAESSNATYSPKDSSAKSISQFFADEVSGVTVNVLQHGAIHAATYLSLIRDIRPGSRVKTIVVTMNLRSFGQLWINSSLETPLMKARVMYTADPPIIKRLRLAFNGFDNRDASLRNYTIERHWRHDKMNLPRSFPYQNVRAWDDATAKSPAFYRPDGTYDSTKMQLACQYVKVYGFSIDTATNPRIADFDAIVKVAKEKHLNLIFSLLPENIQYTDSLAGKELVELIRENRDLLMKRYNRDGVTVVDNLELVNGKDYLDQDGVTEHYDQYGRMLIANRLADCYLEMQK